MNTQPSDLLLKALTTELLQQAHLACTDSLTSTTELFIRPFIFYTNYPLPVMRKLEPIPADFTRKARFTTGCQSIARLTQSNRTAIHTHIRTCGKFRVAS